VRASVSRLARWRPLNVDGRVPTSEPDSDSIWNGNELNPDDAVDSCEPVDRPRVRLSGGAGRFRGFSVVGKGGAVVSGSAPND